jgi:two-component system KDP operon response regulator KdpE
MTGASALRILVVDDEPPIRRMLRASLAAQGYGIVEVANGSDALAALVRDGADLVLLDLGLPDIDGVDVLGRIRASGSSVPVIVLSSHADEPSKVKALDLGADDYVTKPFGIAELLARIRTALRHRLQEQGARPLFKSGALAVDLVRRIVTVHGDEVKLTPREYDLLQLLIAHAGKVLTHKFILDKLWGPEADVQYLRIYVRSLRQKIEIVPERPEHISTEQGVGYRLLVLD